MDDLIVHRPVMRDRLRDFWPPLNQEHNDTQVSGYSYVHYGGVYQPSFYGGSYE